MATAALSELKAFFNGFWGEAMGARDQSVELIGCFGCLDDPRQCTKVIYRLPELLPVLLCAVIAGANDLYRLQTQHGRHNIALAKQIARNIINVAKGKQSFKAARKTADWSENFLSMAIAQKAPTT